MQRIFFEKKSLNVKLFSEKNIPRFLIARFDTFFFNLYSKVNIYTFAGLLLVIAFKWPPKIRKIQKSKIH